MKENNIYTIEPIYKSIYSDLYTPLTVLNVLRKNSKDYFLLESLKDEESWGRYSFLGCNPKLKIKCKDNIVTIKENNIEEIIKTEDPKKIVQSIIDGYRSPKIEGLPSFTGGFVGYFSYDYYKYIEKDLEISALDKYGFDDFNLMLYEKIIAFDNLEKKIFIIINIDIENLKTNREQALLEIDNIIKLIKDNKQYDIEKLEILENLKYDQDKEEYCKKVEIAKKHIEKGYIGQVVISNGLSGKVKGSILNIYRALQVTNPSSYMIYFKQDDLELAAASPETLVKSVDGRLSTFPLAGTRRRGKDKEEDMLLEKELLEDEKELSEHNMLVELGKYDLSKISIKNTIKVEKLRKIERFSQVMHIGSTIVSEMDNSKTQLDIVDAMLPAGTLSGNPKLNACKLIDELEVNKRGIYGGAIGYIDFKGNLDICIGIRMIYKKKDNIVIQSGAGIVKDSVPENEYEECQRKAKAMVKSLEIALNGIN